MKPFSVVAAVVFALVALAHLVRLVLEWSVVIAGIAISPWVSVIAFLVAAALAAMVWREARS